MRKHLLATSALVACLVLAPAHVSATTNTEEFTLETVYDLRDNNEQWSWHPAHQAKWNRFLVRLGVDVGDNSVAAMSDVELERKAGRSDVWARAQAFLVEWEKVEEVVEEVVQEPAQEPVEETPLPPVIAAPQQQEPQQVIPPGHFLENPPTWFANFDSEHTPNDMYAWDKWGPWDDLNIHDRNRIHTVTAPVSNGTSTIANRLFDANADGTVGLGRHPSCNPHCNPINFPDPWHHPTLTGDGTYTWKGAFLENDYIIHSNVAGSHRNPTMVFEVDVNGTTTDWSAAVEYETTNKNGDWGYPDNLIVTDGARTCNDSGCTQGTTRTITHPKAGQAIIYRGDTWSGLKWEGGKLKTIYAPEGEGNDGLTAQFYTTVDPDSSPGITREFGNTVIAGQVRRSKIIGTFITGNGQRR